MQLVSLVGYSVQAVICTTVLLIFCMRRKSLDLYILGVTCVWLIAVIAIYARFGTDQINLYSNDQAAHLSLINDYISVRGISLKFDEIVNWRYFIVLPAYFSSKIGFDPVLILKFSQLVYLVLIYKLGVRFIARNHIRVRVWHTALFCGPILIFMSTLALRDLAIGFFSTVFLLEKNRFGRMIALLITLLLRPHLAVALLFGWIVSLIIKRYSRHLFIPIISTFAIVSYVLGSYSYYIGQSIRTSAPLTGAKEVFNQSKFTRLGANFLGLQFLTLGEDVVSASHSTLFLSRIIFFDTFTTPLLFIVLLFIFSANWTQMRTTVFYSFLFFYGIISQTDWNSSRQNIPFFVSMGLLAVVGIETRRQAKTAGFVS